MKSLLLLRHAKSSWDHPELADFDRPLNKRGEKQAPLMGRHMRERGLMPDLVLSSPARRAAQTTELVVQAAALEGEVRHDARLYGADLATILEVLSEVKADEVLLVGHNPGLEELLEHLTGRAETMPTTALARIVLNEERDLVEGAGRLDWIVRPKELRSSI